MLVRESVFFLSVALSRYMATTESPIVKITKLQQKTNLFSYEKRTELF